MQCLSAADHRDRRGNKREQGRRGHLAQERSIVKRYYVYILASRPGGALYVGITNNLIRRIHEHRNDIVPGHTAKYGIDKLVHFEIFESAHAAIQREKNIKHWPRVWKTRTIAANNPTWRDLYDEIV
jgi:putative endonuclease